MTFILKIVILLMRFIYFFIKLLPTRNKVTMISRQSNKPTSDFLLLKKEIEKQTSFKVVMLTKKLEPSIFKKFLYVFHILRQMYHIATSKVVLLDSYCLPVSLLHHKKKLLVIQMWHAMGSLKKFGYSVVETDTASSAFKNKMTKDRKKSIVKVMRMHKGYDYILTSSDESAPHFAEAFGYPLEKMVVIPLPIVDLLTDVSYQKQMEDEIKNSYPEMRKRKNIVYVPTFRPEEKEDKIQELIDSVDYEHYNLIIKLHPLTKLNHYDERVIWDKQFTSQDMLLASDIIISDYSAIIYEASLLNKPLYFYIYDYNEYVKMRDFYTDFKKELPGFMSGEAKKIIDAITSEKYDLKKIKAFQEKYVNITDKKACERIVAFMLKALAFKRK